MYFYEQFTFCFALNELLYDKTPDVILHKNISEIHSSMRLSFQENQMNLELAAGLPMPMSTMLT